MPKFEFTWGAIVNFTRTVARHEGSGPLRNHAGAVIPDEEPPRGKALDRIGRERQIGELSQRRLRDDAPDHRRELEAVTGEPECYVQSLDSRQRSEHGIPIRSHVIDA